MDLPVAALDGGARGGSRVAAGVLAPRLAWVALMGFGCSPVAADQSQLGGYELEELDAFEGSEELDGPRTTDPGPTTDVQVPWVGPATPGVAGERNTVAVSQVVPGNVVHLLLAPEGGAFDVPDCNLTLDLDDPALLGMEVGDGSGLATFTFDVEPADANQLLVLQAVDLTECVVSAPSRVTFADPGGTTGGTPGGTTPGGDPTVCYPGDRGVYDVCVTLDSAGSQGSDYAYPSSTSWNYEVPTHYLWLDDIPGSVKVAPNFQRDELAQEYKGDWAVVQVHAVERLQDMRDQIGAISVNSGYRSPDYNAGVGGATFSRHMYGDAFDLDPSSVSLGELEDTCYAHGAGFVSVYVSHVHCDWRNDTQEAEFYGSNPPPPLPAGSPLHGAFEGLPIPGARIEAVAASNLLTASAQGFDCGEPLREWVAYDAHGGVVGEGTGPTFEPPEGAVEVTVDVGRVVQERLVLR